MTIAPVIAAPARPATHDPLVAPPATPAVIRYTAQCPDLDALIAVGLALHLFTEIVYGRVDLAVTDLHRATTVLTKQILEALIHHAEHDALRTVLRSSPTASARRCPTGAQRATSVAASGQQSGARPTGAPSRAFAAPTTSASSRCSASPLRERSSTRPRGGAPRSGASASTSSSRPTRWARSSTSHSEQRPNTRRKQPPGDRRLTRCHTRPAPAVGRPASR